MSLHLRELLGGVLGADRRQNHAVATLLPVGGGGEAACSGKLEGIDRADDLTKNDRGGAGKGWRGA